MTVPEPTHATWRVSGAARHNFLHPNQWSPAQPLWGNPFLPQLCTIPTPQLWACKVIKTLTDIMPLGTLLSFMQLAR